MALGPTLPRLASSWSVLCRRMLCPLDCRVWCSFTGQPVALNDHQLLPAAIRNHSSCGCPLVALTAYMLCKARMQHRQHCVSGPALYLQRRHKSMQYALAPCVVSTHRSASQVGIHVCSAVPSSAGVRQHLDMTKPSQ